MRRTVLLALAAFVFAPSAADGAGGKSDATHRSGICGEIRKLDLLLYDEPRGHAPTATCSYTDERLLIRPRTALPDERMKRFVFLAFLVAGKLRNDDFMMPPVFTLVTPTNANGSRWSKPRFCNATSSLAATRACSGLTWLHLALRTHHAPGRTRPSGVNRLSRA